MSGFPKGLAAPPGNSEYGYLSVVTQFYSRPDLALRIPRGAFSPPPEVDSALVNLRLPGESAKPLGIATEQFLDFVKGCFAQKRKTLANNLKPIAQPAQVRELLRKLLLREDSRAEQLSVSELARLYVALNEQHIVQP